MTSRFPAAVREQIQIGVWLIIVGALVAAMLMYGWWFWHNCWTVSLFNSPPQCWGGIFSESS